MSLRDHCISGGDAGSDILDTVPSEFPLVLGARYVPMCCSGWRAMRWS